MASEELKAFHNGNNYRAFNFFGCHKIRENLYVFRVWAPHAKTVKLIGTFNGWDEDLCVMNRLDDCESFEITAFASEGDLYKFCLETYDGRKIYKSDPYAFASGFPESFASKIFCLPEKKRTSFALTEKEQPVNIYEVNLLSWKRHKDNSYYTYKELTKSLVPYVKNMGYTHVEFMPVTEFPFDGSWGYQVTGYFTPTARLGTPLEFRNLIEEFHNCGIKVILDWVPAHFPKDDWGLYEFDGAPLYENALWDKMEHRKWGTRRFDFGRGEIDSFLMSSAVYFIENYSIDGLRVDAVASMLYLNYDKPDGEWTPNEYGDNLNIQAIGFIKKFNSTIKRLYPDVVIIAEDSTTFPHLTEKVENGGLGFDYKWNMGWMNDVLFYCRQDPYFRNYHHEKITFSMMYAFSEKYILPISHDEVVHVKGSVLNKMFGEYDDKFAGERCLLSFMYAHPGKKLNFMGYEVAQFKEWDYLGSIDFFLKKFEKHRKMSAFVKEINYLYRNTKSLYEIENSWQGFQWLVADDRKNNVVAFRRNDLNGGSIIAVFNFSGIDIFAYKIPIEEGMYSVIFNTDLIKYGGNGKIRKRSYKSNAKGGFKLSIDIPKLTCVYLKKIDGGNN